MGLNYRGFFCPKDLDAAVKLLAKVADAKAANHPLVTFNPSPVSSKLYARSPGKFAKCEPAGPADLVACSMFSCRVEPYCQDSEDASEEERDLALSVAQEVEKAFKGLNVPVILIDAGNWFEPHPDHAIQGLLAGRRGRRKAAPPARCQLLHQRRAGRRP